MLKWNKGNGDLYNLEKNALNVYAYIGRDDNKPWNGSAWVIRIGKITISVEDTNDVQFLQAIANGVIQAILKEELRKIESE